MIQTPIVCQPSKWELLRSQKGFRSPQLNPNHEWQGSNWRRQIYGVTDFTTMSLSLWVSRSETICDNQVVHFSATAPTHSGPLTASKKWYVGCADVEQPEEITTSCFKAKSWTAFNNWRGLLPPVYKAKSWTAIQKIVSATQNHASFFEADRAQDRVGNSKPRFLFWSRPGAQSNSSTRHVWSPEPPWATSASPPNAASALRACPSERSRVRGWLKFYFASWRKILITVSCISWFTVSWF